MDKRPHTKLGTLAATPEDVAMLELLGGQTHDGVGLTRGQLDRLWKLYGFQDEHDHGKDPQDAYQASVSVTRRFEEPCEQLLQQYGLTYQKAEGAHGSAIGFNIEVPRDYPGVKVPARRLGGCGSEPAFEIPSWETLRQNAAKATEFAHVGSVRNMIRLAKQDGLRLVAILSKFCEPGEDPARLLCNALADAGFDAPYMGDEDEDYDDDE
jgi:hypothetical protein